MRISNLDSWRDLEKHAIEMEQLHLRDVFKNNNKRFEDYSLQFKDLMFDYSKQRISDTTIELLFKLAKECNLEHWRDRLFSGKPINHTENRSVLHTALRDLSKSPVELNGIDIKEKINSVFKKMEGFIKKIHSGEWLGYTGKPINTIVNIGIGGSDLGPKMLYEALKPYHIPDIDVHFVSNLDGADLAQRFNYINPETTLFTIASKTFTTQETMQNAQTARSWFLRHSKDENAIANHFVAISTNAESVAEFGIDTNNMFEFWDWVGGRYSLWSAIGLPLALGIGMDHFNYLREGAYDVDVHFKTAPLEQNIPVIMALTGIWNRNFLGAETLAILPYEHLLANLPDFLQQLDMESNGKSVDRHGEEIDYATSPVVWGTTGNNGQHAFFQLLHQSNTLTPIDFIGSINSGYALNGHQQKLFSNMIAQAESLMRGKTESEAKAEANTEKENEIVPYRIFKGNVPSNMLLFKNITPHSMGMLVALYEHKVFTQGVIWNLNSFDQWGVELGKDLSKNILHDLIDENHVSEHDSSTEGLMKFFKQHFMDDLH